MDVKSSYEIFKKTWLDEIYNEKDSDVISGRKFAEKLISEWLGNDYNRDSDKIYGFNNRDGGIDFVYFSPDDGEENGQVGNIWYILLTEYSKAFSSNSSLINETRKIIYALEGINSYALPSLSKESDLTLLKSFVNNATDDDKIILMLATKDPILVDQKELLIDIKGTGQIRLGHNFDVKNISIKSIFDKLFEEVEDKNISVLITAKLVPSGFNLWIGSITLENMYHFLTEYERQQSQIDLIYKKNVRMFLGNGKAVNKGISKTIKETPERFGLYNNGVTIVVQDIEYIKSNDSIKLKTPHIVNGCQTTRIIFEELKKKLDNHKFITNSANKEYLERLKQGTLVLKVVKADNDEVGRKILTETTKYTNSQNSVSSKDFIALEVQFHEWAKQLNELYGVFLEIQRGEYKSRKNDILVDEWANAFDLIKIYGAAWLGFPGTAFGKNAPFAPKGRIFEKAINTEQFGVEELYACYLVLKLAKDNGFGEKQADITRGKTKYLFSYVFVELLKELLSSAKLKTDSSSVSKAVIGLLKENHLIEANIIYSTAIDLVDNYMTNGNDYTIFSEIKYKTTQDVNAFFKNDNLGKKNWSPKLVELVDAQKNNLINSNKGQQITEWLKSHFNNKHEKVNDFDRKSVANTKPFLLKIGQKQFNVNSWKGVLVSTFNYIAEHHPDNFANFAVNNNKLLNKDSTKLRNSKNLNNGFSIETNFSADSIKSQCEIVIRDVNENWEVNYI
jgi:hypothetical protein